MNQRLKSAAMLLAAACALAVASNASAQSAGQFTVKAGISRVTPKVDSGDISAPSQPGTKVAVGRANTPVLIFAYGLTDNVSAEFALGLPYKHTLYGDGVIAGTGALATVEALPPSAFIQYRFLPPEATVRPFVGAGLTYAYFQKERGSAQMTAILNAGGPASTFKIDAEVAPTLQAGVAVNLDPRWFADLTVTKTYLKIHTGLSTGQTLDAKLDPVSLILAVGYKF